MSGQTVAVLRGGPSYAYQTSLAAGARIATALANAGYTTKDIVISRQSEWLVGGFVRSPVQALTDVDVVFNALSGPYGEDGTIQRLLDRFAIP